MSDFTQLEAKYKAWIRNACTAHERVRLFKQRAKTDINEDLFFWNRAVEAVDVHVLHTNPNRTDTTGNRGSVAITFRLRGMRLELDILSVIQSFPSPASWLYVVAVEHTVDTTDGHPKAHWENQISVRFQFWTSPFVSFDTRYKRMDKAKKKGGNQ